MSPTSGFVSVGSANRSALGIGMENQMTDRGSTPQTLHRRSPGAVRRWLVGESDRRMLLIVGIVAAIVVGALAWSGRNQPVPRIDDTSSADGSLLLVADPEVSYRVALASAAERVWVIGTPTRLAVGSSAADGTQARVTVFDDAGTETWNATFADGCNVRWVDDDLLVTAPGGSGGYQLSLLDGETGGARWRVPSATADVGYHDRKLYTVTENRVSLIDLGTGAVSKSIDAVTPPTALSTLERYGRFYDVGSTTIQPTSIQMVSADLEPIGTPIPTASGAVFAPFDSGTMVAAGEELIRYDIEGVEQGRWPTPVAGIESLVAVDASLWLAVRGQQITALELAEEAASSTWSVTGTIDAVVADGSSAYISVGDASGRTAIYRAYSGEQVFTSGAPTQLAANGYSVQTGSRLRAYSLPDQAVLYDSGVSPGQSTFVIDGGYVLLGPAPTASGPPGIELTVLG